jgi:hypothetical protein
MDVGILIQHSLGIIWSDFQGFDTSGWIGKKGFYEWGVFCKSDCHNSI